MGGACCQPCPLAPRGRSRWESRPSVTRPVHPAEVWASVTSGMQMTPNLWAESEEELKSLLTKVKEESEKVGSKLNIQKTKIMASSPITSWEIDGETVETVVDFIFGAPKSLQRVTAAMKLKDSYSLEGKL